MHWFNTASVDSKQRHAKEILRNIKVFKDLVYYGFISIERLEKLVAQAKKHLTPEECQKLPAVLAPKRPLGTLDQAASYASMLAKIADWPFYFFGDEDIREKYWGLVRLDQLKTKAKIRQDAQQEIENAKYYRALCYYGFMDPEKALELFQQFKELVGDQSKNIQFPVHLDARHCPTISFDEAYCYAQKKAGQKDWHFYTAAQHQNPSSYWGLNRYEQLKNDYECHSGIGDFFGILFVASGLSFFSKLLRFPMNSFGHQEAKREVAGWCWSKRELFICCTYASENAQTALIRDKVWVERLLTESAQLANPELSEDEIQNSIRLVHQNKPSFESLDLIKFLENFRQSNEHILELVFQDKVLCKQYPDFADKKRAFLQNKVSIENYFDRSKISGARLLS